MPPFQVVQHPDALTRVFVVVPDDDMQLEDAIKRIAFDYKARIEQETPIRTGGTIYQFNFPDRIIAKRAARDFKTVKEFNFR